MTQHVEVLALVLALITDICMELRVAETQECVSSCRKETSHLYKSYCLANKLPNEPTTDSTLPTSPWSPPDHSTAPVYPTDCLSPSTDHIFPTDQLSPSTDRVSPTDRDSPGDQTVTPSNHGFELSGKVKSIIGGVVGGGGGILVIILIVAVVMIGVRHHRKSNSSYQFQHLSAANQRPTIV